MTKEMATEAAELVGVVVAPDSIPGSTIEAPTVGSAAPALLPLESVLEGAPVTPKLKEAPNSALSWSKAR